MKKRYLVFLMLGVTALSTAVKAQKKGKFDENKYLLAISQGKYEDAQAEVDKGVADPKNANNADFLAYQAKIAADIYVAADTNKTVAEKYPDAEANAIKYIDALQSKVTDTAKYNAYIRSANTNLINGYNHLYNSGFTAAIKAFNTKQYKEALAGFEKANKYGGYLVKNGFTRNPKDFIDTTPIMYSGIAAMFLNQDTTLPAAERSKYADTAIMYINQLLALGYTNPNLVSVYDWMIKYYADKGDAEMASKYTADAVRLFPENKEYFQQLQTRQMIEGVSPEQMLSDFNSKKGTLTNDQYIAYGNAFGSLVNKAKDSKEGKKYSDAQIDAYKYAYQFEPTNTEISHAIGLNYVKQWYDIKDEIAAVKGATPAAKAKRVELNKQATVLEDTALIYLKSSYDALKSKSDRTKKESYDLKNTIRAMVSIYESKMTRTRGYDTKAFDKYEALFNKYNKEVQ